ncbi:pectate lyase [Alkalihalobacillus pseudalcaliphilus]|uniref:pectate lyase n=1 Tax=Alkalihalobacillus pseudalcaliphilus TaxID=79884 RepID=UPI00069EFFFC|nr:pectate lyase [Alkalihalobacillus pseudalcaliphilus]
MNKKTKACSHLFLVFILVFSSLFGSLGAAMTVSAEELEREEFYDFHTDFESDQLGEVPSHMDVSEAGGTVRIVQEPSKEENQLVFLDDTSEQTHVALTKSTPRLVGDVSVEMRFMQPTYTSATKVMRVKGDGTAATIETNGGAINFRTGAGFQPLIEAEAGEWYHIQLLLNIEKQTLDILINDEIVLEEAAFDQPMSYLNFVESFTPNSSMHGHYVDDFKMTGQIPTEVEPPEPEIPIEDGVNGIYEAEFAELHHAIVDNKHNGFTGTGFVDYVPNAPGGWIEWTIDVPVAGEYELDFRYAHGGTDLRPKEIVINGEVVDEGLAFEPTGGFTIWAYTSLTANLEAGENTVRAIGIAPSGGANVDHLKVNFGFDQIFEAEEADFNDTSIIDNKHAGYTGTGFVDYVPNAPGGWIEWTVEVPAEGDYFLGFRYAHGGTDLRPKEIIINGERMEEELAFDPTGAWNIWEYATMSSFLKEGTNTIKAVGNAPSGGANVDHLRIYKQQEGDSETPIESEKVLLEEILSEALLKDLQNSGMIAEQGSINDSKKLTRLEFMALVNEKLGFVKKEQFKNLSLDSIAWEITEEDWYYYVAATALQQGYMDDLVVNSQILPTQQITIQEAEHALSKLDDQITPSTNRNILTRGEAKELIDLVEQSDIEQLGIVGVHVLNSHLMAVTLNGYVEDFQIEDLEVVAPTRTWSLLTPGFTTLNIDKAAQTVNQFGQTVIVLNSLDEWDEYGEMELELEETRFSGDLNRAIQEADNLLTWQMEHGGWTKNFPQIYTRPWDGQEPRSEWVNNGVELGTIDNDATISEILLLAQIYQETKDERYKESIEKGFDFLFKLQYETGGFAQVYPARGNYSDYVTFNDEAMINVLEMLDDVLEKRYPFGGDLVSETYYAQLEDSMELAVDYILKAQIQVDGILNVWSAQHDPYTYQPREGRAYEHPSNSGNESVGIIRFLMSRPQIDEIKRATLGALEWFDRVKLENTRYVSGDPESIYFHEDSNSTAWYRFYEIGTDRGIFSGRDGIIKYDILEIEEERRNGYSWGGHWATQLLDVAQNIGFFDNKVFVRIVDNVSVDEQERSLVVGEHYQLKGKVHFSKSPGTGEQENDTELPETDDVEEESDTDQKGTDEGMTIPKAPAEKVGDEDSDRTGQGNQNNEKDILGQDKEGDSLPNTATNYYYWIVAGVILILTGGSMMYWRKRRLDVNID